MCAHTQVVDIESDAHFILLVEKDAAFMRLAEDRFYNLYPCIILTAKGQPDVATRCGPGLVSSQKWWPRCITAAQPAPPLQIGVALESGYSSSLTIQRIRVGRELC